MCGSYVKDRCCMCCFCSIRSEEGHSDSRCYEKIGYPSWWKHNLGPNKNRRGTSSRGGRGSRPAVSHNHPTVAAVASSSESQPPVNLSQTQINQLLSLLHKTGNDQPLANFAGPDDEEDFCDG
ncbi:unnamed protein product [Trifolium pratense]|uniref:Uncharacterized protein n=1 Tax=Trifolium pratense TaxID=57577 RepID=A0ACB0J1D3_TRIPR|nr:unnamed protein product [Trifolium pratense]